MPQTGDLLHPTDEESTGCLIATLKFIADGFDKLRVCFADELADGLLGDVRTDVFLVLVLHSAFSLEYAFSLIVEDVHFLTGLLLEHQFQEVLLGGEGREGRLLRFELDFDGGVLGGLAHEAFAVEGGIVVGGLQTD